MAAHELMDSAESFYENRRESDADLDDTLESAWDQGQALADEIQVSKDFVEGEIDRRGSTPDQVFEAQYDAGVMTEGGGSGSPCGCGWKSSRPPANADHQESGGRYAAYTETSPSGNGTSEVRHPGEASRGSGPGAAAPQQPAEAGSLSQADHAALATMPAAARAVVEREYAANQQAMAPVNALSDKWGGQLASRGATTAQQQVEHVDRVLETEHMLLNGTREQKIQVMQQLAHAAGLGAPTGDPSRSRTRRSLPRPHGVRRRGRYPARKGTRLEYRR